MSDINIQEYIPDSTSQFNIKRFQIGNRKFELPEKTFDVRFLTKNFLTQDNKQILEKTKLVKRFDQIKVIIESQDDKQIDDFFQNKKWTNDFFNIINITFAFNPSTQSETGLRVLDPFLEYYYSHSKNLLTIPNISNKVVNVTEYLKFVDYVYEFFSNMNSKPIFVPISINFGMKGINEIIEHYLSKEYYYIWFDFEGKAINENNSARLKRIRRIIEEKNVFDKVIFYFTNIKREIMSNVKSNDSAGSDILASLGGANIIGVNREPQKFNPNAKTEKPNEKELWKHKARFFDKETYYYKKFNETNLELKNVNISKNSSRLQDELNHQTQIFLERLKIKEYINQKPITNEHPILFKNLFS